VPDVLVTGMDTELAVEERVDLGVVDVVVVDGDTVSVPNIDEAASATEACSAALAASHSCENCENCD
jgi:hypothetical protein